MTLADYGANDPVANFAYDLFRSSSGDNLATSVRDITGTQAIAGSVIYLSDFNVPPSSPIYGHPLFSNNSSGVIAAGSDPKHLRTERAARYFASGLSNANFPLAAGAMNFFRNAFTRTPAPNSLAREISMSRWLADSSAT